MTIHNNNDEHIRITGGDLLPRIRQLYNNVTTKSHSEEVPMRFADKLVAELYETPYTIYLYLHKINIFISKICNKV